jgi:hypothetical protein
MHKFVRVLKGPAKFIWPLRGPFVLAARKYILSISESELSYASYPDSAHILRFFKKNSISIPIATLTAIEATCNLKLATCKHTNIQT